ncbi:MAG: aspartate--tRNA(Asn) ligase [bacterium]|nr:aspartate--tRNA(Asn) ligase [bacterium]
MERTLIGNLAECVGEHVAVSCWVDVRRDHGKLMFLVLRDRTGNVQAVVNAKDADVFAAAEPLRSGWVIEAEGEVKERPENMKKDEPNGAIELGITKLTVLAHAEELPFDPEAELNLDTYLDHLPLTLRTQRGRDIFNLSATVLQSYRWALIQRGFTEFMAPILVGEDAEGGAAAFKVGYYEKAAYLATSPQLYKEVMTGVFERAFTITKAFRGEKHATTRHLSEATQMDFEMAFIKDHHDVMAMLEYVIRETCAAVVEQRADVFNRFKTEAPLMPDEPFPILRLSEAQEILEKEFGAKAIGEPDLEPEHERQICEWAKKEKGSDFVFITHFPTVKRAFYSYPDPENSELSLSFDLLFRGLEINSGSQRYHDHDALVETLKSRGLDPEKFSFYLQLHKYGVPPHGGCSTGLERFVMKMLGLSNIREATAFPRDMNRIDVRLSE